MLLLLAFCLLLIGLYSVVAGQQKQTCRRTSSLVRATLLRRKISQLNSSATSFITSIFTNSSTNDIQTSPSLSLTNNREESTDANSPRLSTSKASSSTGSEIPPDPRTASTSSDELKIEIVEIKHDEIPVDDEQTIQDADQTLKTEEVIEEASSSENENSSEDDRLVTFLACEVLL